jgi:hypothetical protein
MFAGCGHVSGLLMRLILPLVLMKSARQVPIRLVGTVRQNELETGRAVS